MLDLNVTDLVTRIPIVLLALTVHEFCHAYVAYRLGDPTAYRMGRCTLNPLSHLDFLGTLCIMFGPIGWAKPVPVNSMNFHHPSRDNMVVSIAGPASNILQAIAFALILRLVVHADFVSDALSDTWRSLIGTMCFMGVLVNCGLAVFNMLPIYPLDGFHVTRYFLSPEAKRSLDATAQYGMFIILGLVLLPRFVGMGFSPLGMIIMYPVSWLLRHVSGVMI